LNDAAAPQTHPLSLHDALPICHAVEAAHKTADARGGRAQLDDQVADFRLRHGAAHRVPARPALAGVEAENLAAPPGQNGVDPGRSEERRAGEQRSAVWWVRGGS